jgi:tetratricopeptide (TPR) repeat protein
MNKLEPPDSLHLEAAKGWCELHDFLEADAELNDINPSLQTHPSVSEVRWQICANLEKWAGALEMASAIVKMEPDWPNGWIYRASSLAELNRRQEAYDTLKEAIARFPTDEIILYDLACVGCTLKRFDEAREWLAKAIDAGGNEVKLKAMDDPDLEPIRASIKQP